MTSETESGSFKLRICVVGHMGSLKEDVESWRKVAPPKYKDRTKIRDTEVIIISKRSEGSDDSILKRVKADSTHQFK